MANSTEHSRSVRTRVAPSPTGTIHIGTAYMSLFNYVFAKKNNGKFILRLEDTDIKRHVKGAIEMIYEGLDWLGLKYDKRYIQSERLSIYKKEAERLLTEGKVYKDKGALRLKSKKEGKIFWDDIVRGHIEFPASELTDFVILKSNGYPTYNFAVTVDDHMMKITHVIRGEEHISNTPRQLALYEALGYELPKFAHIPLLRNPDRSKISKRKNPISLLWYREEGYLPEAILNFLTLLAWSHPEGKEIFDLEEMIETFDLSRFHKTSPIFDMNKLDWINGYYIRNLSDEEFTKRILNFYEKKYPKEKIKKIVPIVKDRIKKLSEFESFAGFFFKKPEVDHKLFGKNYKMHLLAAIKGIEKGEKDLLNVVKENKFKTGDFFMDLRIAITGSKFTPPINESIVILGKEEILKRLRNAAHSDVSRH